jgi:RimJ/RimL family protein N-acetyltransferase
LDSSFDNRYLLDIPRSYYYKNTGKSSISVSIPFGVEVKNIRPFITERLIIRPLRISDAEGYSLVSNDPKVNYYQSLWRDVRGLDNIISQIKGDIKHYHDTNLGVSLGIFLKNMQGEEGELIGQLYGSVCSSDHFPGISYMFKRQYWGKGYGSESLEA